MLEKFCLRTFKIKGQQANSTFQAGLRRISASLTGQSPLEMEHIPTAECVVPPLFLWNVE